MSQRRRMLRAVARKGDTADVYVEGIIGDRDGTTAASFREQLQQARGAKVLRVHFNSDGGVVTEGTAMYNALRAFDGKKIGIVEGIAASIASIVLMGCDEIRMAKGAYVMIHNPSGAVRGGADDMRGTADALDKMRSDMLDIYEARTGIDRAKLEKLVDAETYFTAEEAVEIGIADSIEGYEARIALDAVARLNPDKVPAGLRAAAKGKVMKGKKAKMKALEEEMAVLKAKMAECEAEEGDDDEEEETSEDDDKPKDEDDDKEEAKALTSLVLEMTGEKSIASATGKLAALLAKAGAATSTARADLVTAAIKAGKLPPAMKAWALKASEAAFGAYLKGMGGAQALKLGKKHHAPAESGGDENTLTDAEAIVAKQMRIPAADMIKARGTKPRPSGLIKGEEG